MRRAIWNYSQGMWDVYFILVWGVQGVNSFGAELDLVPWRAEECNPAVTSRGGALTDIVCGRL